MFFCLGCYVCLSAVASVLVNSQARPQKTPNSALRDSGSLKIRDAPIRHWPIIGRL